MTQLDRYLRNPHSMTAIALAKVVGVSAPYITDLRYGKRRPSEHVALKIEAATDGVVKASDWRHTGERK